MSQQSPIPTRSLRVVAFGVSVALGACAQPPELPPADSMDLGQFKKGAAGALTAQGGSEGGPVAVGGSTANVDLAAAAVGVVTLAIDAALLTPRLVFAGVLSQKAKHDGSNWVWENTFPLAGWSAKLTGHVDSQLELEMRITGLREPNTSIKDFVWYTGSHSADHGVWKIYKPEVAGEVVEINWSRRSATDKDVTFANVTAGDDGNGDTVKYALEGNLASMTIHDAKDTSGAPADASVVWNVVSGSGKLMAKEPACWDTIAQGQVDIPCPAGDWPAP